MGKKRTGKKGEKGQGGGRGDTGDAKGQRHDAEAGTQNAEQVHRDRSRKGREGITHSQK